MFFQLIIRNAEDDEYLIDVLDPQMLYDDCTAHGIDTSSWYGKANCMVDRRGIHPSYGYFLISGEHVEKILEGADPTDTAKELGYNSKIYKVDVEIEFDELDNEDVPKYEILKNLYVKDIMSVVPSVEGKPSRYLVHVVDARANIPGVEMGYAYGTNLDIQTEYINRVVSYTDSDFVYDSESVRKYDDTEEVTEPTSTEPLSWEDVIATLLNTRCGGAYSDSSEGQYPAEDPMEFSVDATAIEEWPEDVPQDVYVGLNANIADTLYKLLFTANVDLLYYGDGEFILVPVADVHEFDINEMGDENENPAVFDPVMEFDTELSNYLEDSDNSSSILKDKKFHLFDDGRASLPGIIVACCKWISDEDEGIDAARYKQVKIPVLYDNDDYLKHTGPGVRRVEIPYVWTAVRDEEDEEESTVLSWFTENWGTAKERRFWQYPRKQVVLAGFLPIYPRSYIERVSWFYLDRENAGTLVENILPVEWDRLYPREINKSAPGGGTPINMKVVLIDADIEGIGESDPSVNILDADIPLTEEEVADNYMIVYQDPPDDDLTANLVDELNLWKYARKRIELKYYESTPDVTGTAVSGSSSLITLEEGSSEEDDFYNDKEIEITEGAGVGQINTIIDYDGATRVATVSTPWDPSVDETSKYRITTSGDSTLAYTVIDDPEHNKKIVRYSTIKVWYDDGRSFLIGEYKRSDYPDYPENDEFPPDGLPEGFLNRRFRGIVINGVLITALCKELPPPELP